MQQASRCDPTWHPVTLSMTDPGYDKPDCCKDVRASKGAITAFFSPKPQKHDKALPARSSDRAPPIASSAGPGGAATDITDTAGPATAGPGSTETTDTPGPSTTEAPGPYTAQTVGPPSLKKPRVCDWGATGPADSATNSHSATVSAAAEGSEAAAAAGSAGGHGLETVTGGSTQRGGSAAVRSAKGSGKRGREHDDPGLGFG